MTPHCLRNFSPRSRSTVHVLYIAKYICIISQNSEISKPLKIFHSKLLNFPRFGTKICRPSRVYPQKDSGKRREIFSSRRGMFLCKKKRIFRVFRRTENGTQSLRRPPKCRKTVTFAEAFFRKVFRCRISRQGAFRTRRRRPPEGSDTEVSERRIRACCK